MNRLEQHGLLWHFVRLDFRYCAKALSKSLSKAVSGDGVVSSLLARQGSDQSRADIPRAF